MSIISFLCFLIVGLIFLSLRYKGDIFSPGRIFGVIWFLAIGLTDLKFSRLQHPWTMLQWCFLLIGVFSFLMGIVIVNVVYLGKPTLSIDRIRQIVSKLIYNDVVAFRVVIFLFFLYMGSYSIAVIIHGSVPLFSKVPSEARTRFGIFGIGLLIHLAPTVMYLIVQYYLLVKNRTKSKLVLAVIFLMTSISYFLLLQRYAYALWAVLTIVFLYYGSRHITLKKGVVIVAIFIGLFYWISSIRLTGQVAYYSYIMSEMKFPHQYAIFTEPYMYLVTNLENFTHASSKLEQFTFGYYTFDFIAALSGVKHWIANYFVLNETPFLTSGYNTYSFFWNFYRDFGLIGLTLCSMLEGLFIGLLYNRMRQSPSILLITAYAIAVFVMIFSFFNHALSMLHFVFNTGVLVVANALVLKRKNIIFTETIVEKRPILTT